MSFIEQLRLLHPGWRDALEVALVSYAVYRVLLVLQRTRAMHVLVGLVMLAAVFGAAVALGLDLIVYLLGEVFKYAAFALIVVFAPELRAALALIGRSPMSRFFSHMEATEIADEIAQAAERLSHSGVGAIIAVEREVSLDEYAHAGALMHAKVSADLLATIFTRNSPLHDGAVIVRGDTVVGARCILPLSQAAVIDRALGTRHRAALGLSEETDALVIVVSEETSTISVAANGRLWRNVTPAQVRDLAAGGSLRQVVADAAV